MKSIEDQARAFSKFDSATDIGTDLGSYRQGLFEGFLAGYQAAKPQWISVKDRLPEEGVWVLGYYLIYENNIYDVGVVKRFVHTWAEANIWLTNHKNGPLTYEEVDSITHWQPLPAPPKEEK